MLNYRYLINFSLSFNKNLPLIRLLRRYHKTKHRQPATIHSGNNTSRKGKDHLTHPYRLRPQQHHVKIHLPASSTELVSPVARPVQANCRNTLPLLPLFIHRCDRCNARPAFRRPPSTYLVSNTNNPLLIIHLRYIRLFRADYVSLYILFHIAAHKKHLNQIQTATVH